MIGIVCLDQKNGMYFNERRQSRDRYVIRDILDQSEMEKLIVYRWDKVYPADHRLNLSGWKLIGTLEFMGYSHDKIVKEVYKRNEK